jgi:hypothetical protein
MSCLLSYNRLQRTALHAAALLGREPASEMDDGWLNPL